MSSSLLWSNCTPFNYISGMYNVFNSKYKNLRYRLKPSSTYTVTQKDVANLPGISYNVYGTTDFWHVILVFNGLSDPLNDLYPGLVLQIPDKTSILTALTSDQGTTRNRVTI